MCVLRSEIGMNDKPRRDREAGYAGRTASIGRRGFLGALAAGAVATISPPVAGGPVGSRETGVGARYRETAHAQTFYRLSRYPGGRPC
jgi:hypothetical protein